MLLLEQVKANKEMIKFQITKIEHQVNLMSGSLLVPKTSQPKENESM